MKKIFISAYMLMAFAGYAAAQTTPVKTETKTTTHKTRVKKTTNAPSNRSSNTQSTTTQTDSKAAGGTISEKGTKVTKTTKTKNP